MTTEPAKTYHKGSENLVMWKPGQSGNPKGRGKGNRNKLGEAFLGALHDDFVAHGPEAIIECREKHPAAYLRVIASLIPKDLSIEIAGKDKHLSDTEVKDRIRELAARLGYIAGPADDQEQLERVEELRRINSAAPSKH